ncbi:MAG: PEP-utilizing enzyme [Anaerolineales bacterium]|jgi:phosphohistidine swiveling domain-containing protein
MPDQTILGTFFGDEAFPIKWDGEEEKRLHWFFDDLHCPQPITPMYFDVGGWWLTTRYMYKRFGLPFGNDWIAKKINNYVYSAIVPQTDEEVARLGPYFNMVLPVYANNFLDWWRDRLVPEVKRNFEFLDSFDYENASLPELMVFLEDALDIQDRHFRIHWLLNMAQFASFLNFESTFKAVTGSEDPVLVGKIEVSIDDRNWDSIKGLTKLRDKVRENETLSQAFQGETASEVVASLKTSDEGKQFLKDVDDWAQEYGYKAIYTHEYIYPLWVEKKAPIIEAIKGYLESDYDVEKEIKKVEQSQKHAIEEMFSRVDHEEGRKKLQDALDMALKMAPLTPDHHFYFDQGTYGRLRLVFLAIGRKLAENDVLDSPEDIFYLTYDELRHISAVPDAFDAKELTASRRDENIDATEIRPRDWAGTVTQWSLYEEPYKGLWGFPEKFTKTEERAKEAADIVSGLAASPGVVEGTARFVQSPEQFDEVQRGEIMVCKMTNPAWVVVFTKIKGLVTDSGGVLAHPAVVSREFGIPAVVGTSVATEKIRTGMRIRVNGNTGVVEIIG